MKFIFSVREYHYSPGFLFVLNNNVENHFREKKSN